MNDYISRENPSQECTLCRRYGLEKGDTLYQVEYPDTGIDFYAIYRLCFNPLRMAGHSLGSNHYCAIFGADVLLCHTLWSHSPFP